MKVKQIRVSLQEKAINHIHSGWNEIQKYEWMNEWINGWEKKIREKNYIAAAATSDWGYTQIMKSNIECINCVIVS